MQGLDCVEGREEVTVQKWMRQRGIPDHVTEEIFLTMSKGLNLINHDRLSIQCVLITLNRFLQETDESKVVFLDGSLIEHLFNVGLFWWLYIYVRYYSTWVTIHIIIILTTTPQDYLLKVMRFYCRLCHTCRWHWTPSSQTIVHYAYFQKMMGLKGAPLINLHIWFDKKLSTVDGICFGLDAMMI